MCGIAGWLDWKVDLTQQGPTVQAMVQTLGHRGPDAQGAWLSTRAALAHCRLIVIDPAGGAQPMLYQVSGRTYALTYNGEIYNFRELRRLLATRGHTFHTNSDTEVLLHAYVEWGEDCVRQLNGIFAFALWDEHRQHLLLARDHLGVKPLFYTQRQSAVLFGSEIKALLAHPLVSADVRAEGLAELVSYAPIQTPGFTIYHDIYAVRPGHYVIFSCHGVRVTPYWSLQSAPHTDDLATTTERLRALLEDTVKRQLIADVPVVTMLSGGLDSSGITALAAQTYHAEGRPLHTYAIDYVDSARYFVSSALQPSLDIPWAERVAQYLGTEHHTITVETPELLEHFLTPTYARDLPGLGQLDVSLYLLCKAMKQDAKVALSGEGADEVFGGYPWFHSVEAMQASTFPWMAMFDRPGMAQQHFAWLSAETRTLAQPQAYIVRRYQEAMAEVPRLAGEEALSARRREICYLHLTRWLSMLLERKDRMSMATGFEVRVPFCDYRLIEYVWNVPWELKTVDQFEKGLLRRALADLLPEDVRNRHKSAYPISQHPAYLAGIRELALTMLHDPQAPALPFLNVSFLRLIAAGKLPAVPDHLAVGLLERIIQLDAWLRTYHVRIS